MKKLITIIALLFLASFTSDAQTYTKKNEAIVENAYTTFANTKAVDVASHVGFFMHWINESKDTAYYNFTEIKQDSPEYSLNGYRYLEYKYEARKNDTSAAEPFNIKYTCTNVEPYIVINAEISGGMMPIMQFLTGFYRSKRNQILKPKCTYTDEAAIFSFTSYTDKVTVEVAMPDGNEGKVFIASK